MSKYNPNIHHRRSIRLKGYDYTQSGAYFITIVTQNRRHLFGRIQQSEISLSPAGEIVRVTWLKLPAFFSIHLDEWCIMPNHFHGIIWLIDKDIQAKRLKKPQPSKDKLTDSFFDLNSYRLQGTKSGSLNAIIQNFKSISTRKINQKLKTPGNKIWQRNYYEHIIRNNYELNAIRQYIRNNLSRTPPK